jgi:hypothetical protein
MTPRSRLKTLVVALGFFVPWLLLQAAWAPPVAAQDIVVSAADPPSAPQGTVSLDVTIKGNNFKRGAVSRFVLTGTTNPGGVTVKKTTFVNRTELRANIDIADTAELSKFDIEVQNSDGRTGKGIELFTVTEKVSIPASDTLPIATFRDSGTDRLRSDGQGLPSPCPQGDYAALDHPCNPGHPGVSSVTPTGMYFMRTVSGHVPNPTRYLVLDFSQGIDGATCPKLDTALANYWGRSSLVEPLVNPADCVDWLMVRFSADKAFAHGAEFAPVGLVIDGPDGPEISNVQSTGLQWNGKYYLDFVNPLKVTRLDAYTVELETMEGLEQTQLWTINPKNGKRKTLVGTYSMPFQVTVAVQPWPY